MRFMRTRQHLLALQLCGLVALGAVVMVWSAGRSVAAGKFQYKAVRCDSSSIQTILDQHANEGWELVQIDSGWGFAVFKK